MGFVALVLVAGIARLHALNMLHTQEAAARHALKEAIRQHLERAHTAWTLANGAYVKIEAAAPIGCAIQSNHCKLWRAEREALKSDADAKAAAVTKAEQELAQVTDGLEDGAVDWLVSIFGWPRNAVALYWSAVWPFALYLTSVVALQLAGEPKSAAFAAEQGTAGVTTSILIARFVRDRMGLARGRKLGIRRMYSGYVDWARDAGVPVVAFEQFERGLSEVVKAQNWRRDKETIEGVALLPQAQRGAME
jgi:hypothetical protein